MVFVGVREPLRVFAPVGDPEDDFAASWPSHTLLLHPPQRQSLCVSQVRPPPQRGHPPAPPQSTSDSLPPLTPSRQPCGSGDVLREGARDADAAVHTPTGLPLHTCGGGGGGVQSAN